MKRLIRRLMIVTCAAALAGCVSETEEDQREAMGSHLAQPPPGTPRPAPTPADDIAIVGQDVAHAVLDLPPIRNATVPPLVRFNGVTSIVDKPIDTEPYTELLRDRLLLLTREKLRFVEHTLPPYVPPSKHKQKEQPVQNTTNADYQVLAELRGKAESDSLKIQVEFVDAHSGDVLYNETFRIGKESDGGSSATPEPYGGPAAPAPPPTHATQTETEPQPGLDPNRPEKYVPPTAQPTQGSPTVYNNGVL
jgi:hypothetical protein